MRRLILLIALFLLATPAFASATAVYLAPTAVGAGTAVDCADAAAATTFFNSSANWGAGGSQIGPGTTVNLCAGTYTGSAGATSFLTFQAGGTAGNPITLLFNSGAVITSTNWAGPVINLAAKSYVTVNGGTNGTIQATANGSGLAHQTDNGICVNNGTPSGSSSNVTVENLTCSNLYVESSPSDNGGEDTYAIDIWNVSNLTIQGNTFHDMKWAVRNSYAVGSTFATPVLTMTGNNIYNMDHGYFMTDSNSSGTATASGWFIYGNTFGSMTNWDNTADDNHHDWIHFNANSSSSRFSNFYVYNNTFSGDVGANGNAGVFVNESGFSPNVVTNINAFNNVFANTATNHCFANGFFSLYAVGTALVVNNTLVSSSTSSCINNGSSLPGDNGIDWNSGSTGLTWENNVVQHMTNNGIFIAGSATVTAMNYNNYYQVTSWTDGSNYSTLAAWHTGTGFDANSQTTNPNLNGSYQPNAGSPLLAAGVNLTSLCTGGVAPLCSDKGGNARPSTGAWTIGAYQGASSTFTLTVDSTNPASSVVVSVSPADNNGHSTVTTPGTLIYTIPTTVTLTAPGTASGNPFSNWSGTPNPCSTMSLITCIYSTNTSTTLTANYTPPTPPAVNPVIIMEAASVQVPAGGTQQLTVGCQTAPCGTVTYTATAGSVSASGLFTAPATAQTVTVSVAASGQTTPVTLPIVVSAPVTSIVNATCSYAESFSVPATRTITINCAGNSCTCK